MEYKINISDLAKADLDGNLDYIANKLHNKKAALDLKVAFKECFEFLKTSPRMYPECHDSRLAREGYRKAIVKNYIGLYKVDDENKVVNMIRIVYGRMDYSKLV